MKRDSTEGKRTEVKIERENGGKERSVTQRCQEELIDKTPLLYSI